jgi:hypothetical protein
VRLRKREKNKLSNLAVQQNSAKKLRVELEHLEISLNLKRAEAKKVL